MPTQNPVRKNGVFAVFIMRRMKGENTMQKMGCDWYRKIWTLDIQDQSWVEDTERQVDFIIRKLNLRGNEKILDLACGFGRHSLALARRGFDVTGVDITPDYVRFASETAGEEGLSARFFCADIRDVCYEQAFDVILNMADGAVGYLESDTENGKIFEVVSRALKHGGKHFMDIMNGAYAQSHFPCKLWDAGEKGITLSAFEWDSASRTMLYGQLDYTYGESLTRPEFSEGNPIRLYTLEEIIEIYSRLGLYVVDSFADFTGKPSSPNAIQLLISSVKK